MFDSVGDGDPVDAMGAAARAESAAIARRLSAAGELYARRSCEWAGRELWCADPFEAVAAEVSAAQNISRGRAGTQIRYALELRDRLPGVAAVFAAGEVDFRMVSTIINRTSNVTDESIGAIDAALARLAPRWMRRSDALGALAPGARLTPLGVPDGPEPGYRLSAGLARFIRWRDLSCRWPGCEARICDTDHTVPYPQDRPIRPTASCTAVHTTW